MGKDGLFLPGTRIFQCSLWVPLTFFPYGLAPLTRARKEETGEGKRIKIVGPMAYNMVHGGFGDVLYNVPVLKKLVTP